MIFDVEGLVGLGTTKDGSIPNAGSGCIARGEIFFNVGCGDNCCVWTAKVWSCVIRCNLLNDEGEPDKTVSP